MKNNFGQELVYWVFGNALGRLRAFTVVGLFALLIELLGGSDLALAASEAGGKHLDLTNHWIGYTAIGVFTFAYLFVMVEEFTHLRK